MTGVEVTDHWLVVEREPNKLDELAIAFSESLPRQDIDHAFVADYVAILTGRPRSTDDIDVFIEQCSEVSVDNLVEELHAEVLGASDATVRDVRKPRRRDEHPGCPRRRDDTTSGGEVSGR